MCRGVEASASQAAVVHKISPETSMDSSGFLMHVWR